MSMLTRKGTIVRSHRPGSGKGGSFKGKRTSRRPTLSSTSSSGTPSGVFRHTGVVGHGSGRSSTEEYPLQNGYGRHPRATRQTSLADVVVFLEDERASVRTSVGGWDFHPSADDSHQDYGAFMYQIREANKEADNIIQFACKTSSILSSSLFVTVLMGASLVLPLAMLSIGVKYLEDCPREPRIPIYLLVGGGFGLMKLLLSMWRNIHNRRNQDVEAVFDDDNEDGDSAFSGGTFKTMNMLLFLFMLCWQIVGTFWTFGVWKPHFKQLLHEPSNWCDQNVFMFAVYQQTVCYSVMALYLVVLITVTCCVRCK